MVEIHAAAVVVLAFLKITSLSSLGGVPDFMVQSLWSSLFYCDPFLRCPF